MDQRVAFVADWLRDEWTMTVLALRRRYPHWGSKKLRAVLQERAPDRVWPAASTMGDLLRRAGISQPRAQRRVDGRFQGLVPHHRWDAAVIRWAFSSIGSIPATGSERAARAISSDPATGNDEAAGRHRPAAATAI